VKAEIPGAAVEAVAKRRHEGQWNIKAVPSWDSLYGPLREAQLETARAYVEAAYPHLLESFKVALLSEEAIEAADREIYIVHDGDEAGRKALQAAISSALEES
jgi:Arc/MetJ family transcription regulator